LASSTENSSSSSSYSTENSSSSSDNSSYFILPTLAKKPSKHTEYYERLGVDPSIDKSELKKAFRAKSKELHPDKCGQGKSKEEQDKCQSDFIAVSHAHDILSDDEKRKLYDEGGEEGLEKSGKGGFDAEAMFEQVRITYHFFVELTRISFGAEAMFEQVRKKWKGRLCTSSFGGDV
jgi:DnaJ-class molecular chaperone